MADITQLRSLANELGLSGEDAVKFILHQQNVQREEISQERELKKQELEKELEQKRLEDREKDRVLEFQKLEERRKDRQHEIDMHSRRVENPPPVSSTSSQHSQEDIKLLSFKEGDDFSVFLSYFERISDVSHWDLEREGVVHLLPLL